MIHTESHNLRASLDALPVMRSTIKASQSTSKPLELTPTSFDQRSVPYNLPYSIFSVNQHHLQPCYPYIPHLQPTRRPPKAVQTKNLSPGPPVNHRYTSPHQLLPQQRPWPDVNSNKPHPQMLKPGCQEMEYAQTDTVIFVIESLEGRHDLLNELVVTRRTETMTDQTIFKQG